MLAAVVAATLAGGLAACSPPEPAEPRQEAATSSATSSAPPSSAPESSGPTYVADGSAADNLPLFTAVTAQVWSSESRNSGRAYVDALVGAGFDRAAMQVTQDATTVGNPVESLQFSVRWGETECLVGQVGPSTGEPVTAVMPQLAEGRCLVGTTRAIDW